jgi:hypothetical protein
MVGENSRVTTRRNPNCEGTGDLGGRKHMGNNTDTQRSEVDTELEGEIRKERKFTLEEAIGRFVLAGYCQQVLDSDFLLKELVRDADIEWRREMGERTYFEKEGAPQHPDDSYTVESVRSALSGVLKQLASGQG